MKMLRFDVLFRLRFLPFGRVFKIFSFHWGVFIFIFFLPHWLIFLGFGPGFGHCPVFLFQVSQ
uniref:Uncharacterized protein n=1 Tax=Anguilla anguilla TaxID=7936 RepID=A0A0E9UZU8_ANGAN